MKNILPIENIFLNLPVMQKEEAIYTAAEVLRKGGYVTEAYYEAMLLKEKECETYIGNGVAIQSQRTGNPAFRYCCFTIPHTD